MLEKKYQHLLEYSDIFCE